MKIRTISFSLLFLSALMFSCKNNKNNTKPGPPPTDEKSKSAQPEIKDNSPFSVKVPEGWSRLDTNFLGFPAVVLNSEPEGPADTFSENINIVTERIGNSTLEEYVSASNRNMSTMLTGYTEKAKKDITVSGVPAKSINYSHTPQGYGVDVNVVMVVKDGKAYVITSSAEKGKLNKWQKEIDEVVNSFQIN